MTTCTRCASAIEDGDLRCAICALVVPPPERPADAEPHPPRARVLRCRECNAAVAFCPISQAPRCAFCGATMDVEHAAWDPPEAAQRRVPFVVDRGAAERALRGWLSTRGFFAPRRLVEDAVPETFTPVLWPAWIVNARALVTWAADSNAGARRSAWAPHAGEVSLELASLCVPASRGLDLDECMKLVPHYDLASAVPATAGEPEHGATIEAFEAQRSAARALVQDAIERTARTRVEDHLPGTRFRNVHVACLLQGQTTDRAALPAWVLAYRYRGKPYRAIVHGQRANVVIGRAPLDWAKLVKLAGVAVLVVAAIVLAAVLLSDCRAREVTPHAPIARERAPSGHGHDAVCPSLHARWYKVCARVVSTATPVPLS